jgi:antitoxin (DNA-binding transcriptional repressor) of toxin-antitoxin stability system
MATVPVRELSHHTARCLALVKAGEAVDITERGRVIGRIVPVEPEDDARARLIAHGRVRPATRGRAELLAQLRREAAGASTDEDNSVSEALKDLRDGERY